MINEKIFEILKREFVLQEIDIKEDAHLSKKGFKFNIKVYNVPEVGHLSFLTLSGMLGLMKMDTMFLTSNEVDAPLFSIDLVKAMGKYTAIVELYDTQLKPVDEKYAKKMTDILERDKDIVDYDGGEHWYDSLREPFSYAKKPTKKTIDKAEKSLLDYVKVFSEYVKGSKPCKKDKKVQKNREYVDNLLKNGGPAVNTFKKLFGEEKTKQIIINYLYWLE